MSSPDYIKALYDVLDELDNWIDITGYPKTLQLFRTNLVLRIDSATANGYLSETEAPERAPVDTKQLLLELG
jgi:hypothetical protein